LINTTAQSNNIAISRIQAKSDSVQLWIDDVNFNQFVTWLEELSKQYEVDIQNVDISATDSPGMIKVSRLQLGR
jgi:general secretion pathway protein M